MTNYRDEVLAILSEEYSDARPIWEYLEAIEKRIADLPTRRRKVGATSPTDQAWIQVDDRVSVRSLGRLSRRLACCRCGADKTVRIQVFVAWQEWTICANQARCAKRSVERLARALNDADHDGCLGWENPKAGCRGYYRRLAKKAFTLDCREPR